MIFLWLLSTLSTSINFSKTDSAPFFSLQAEETKNSFWPILRRLPYSASNYTY